MEEDQSQREVDLLAKNLRNTASHFSDWFQVAYGLDADTERVLRYVNEDLNYKDLLPNLEGLLDEAEEALPDEKVYNESRGEQLYRKYRDRGYSPVINEEANDWRKLYSEADQIDIERDTKEGEIDYRPLIRAVIDVRTFLGGVKIR
ncbi:MAG: hypothetical protein V5A72_03255 [Candidatus Nanohaloarchaea archaeon]